MGLLTEDIRRFVNMVKLGFAATVCVDGTPNLSPKGTTIAWDEDHLAFADIYSPGTVENLRHNNSIEINTVDIFMRKGYRFKGVAEVLSAGELFDAILENYKRTAGEYKINNIVLVKVERVIPLSSPAYDHMTESEITEKYIGYWSDINEKRKITFK
jgi:uncharacterized protein